MLIDKFLIYLQLEKNYSTNTVSAYKCDLTQYNEFIVKNSSRTEIEKANYKIIRSWIVSMVKDNVSNLSLIHI
mgnify:FL=1